MTITNSYFNKMLNDTKCSLTYSGVFLEYKKDGFQLEFDAENDGSYSGGLGKDDVEVNLTEEQIQMLFDKANVYREEIKINS